ncbi:MAG: DinB family protein [Bacteroidetes bacterium]|nr:DinB family protein [Bacteroidota bacterium]
MQLAQYLIDTFQFNDKANRQIIEKIKDVPGNEEIIRLLSHLINCQYKWMARIVQDPKATEMDWWLPLYKWEELITKWTDSLSLWITYIQSKTEDELNTEVTFIGFDGSPYAATPADIALQLNYHSIHHRAQIQTILRQLGITPDFVDYIGTRYRKI